MDKIEKLHSNYIKTGNSEELRGRTSLSEPKPREAPSHTPRSVFSDLYIKGPGTIPAYLIIAVSGGEVRERAYLSELSRRRTFPHIELHFFSSEKHKGGLSPKMMKERLNEIIDFNNQNSKGTISYTSIDKIFMITDVDHYYEELKELISLRKDPKENWLISNPCFEMWLYYSCFSEITDALRVLEGIPQSRQSSTLKNINGTLVKGGIDPRKAFTRLPQATENSKKNFNRDQNKIPKLFSTNMHEFGEFILGAIGETALDTWLKENQKRIETFRKGIH